MKYNINFDERVVYFGEGNQEPVVMTFEELKHLQEDIDYEEMSKVNLPSLLDENFKEKIDTELDRVLNIRTV